MALTKVTYSMIDGATVNVLDYGADPTDINDSAAAINAAITAAAANNIDSVYLPAGTYKCASTITLLDNITLFGEGKASALHFLPSGGGQTAGITVANKTNFQIKNLRVYGNSTASVDLTWAIRIYGSNNGIVSNCFIDTAFLGVFVGDVSITQSNKILITNNTISNIGLNGIGVNTFGSKIDILGNSIYQSGTLSSLVSVGSGIEFRSATNSVIGSNNLDELQYGAAGACDGIRLEYGTPEPSNPSGQQVQNVSVVNNVISNFSGFGIRGQMILNCSITGNSFYSSNATHEVGLVLLGDDTNSVTSSYNTVSGNTFFVQGVVSSVEGIRLQGDTTQKVIFNNINGNTFQGYRNGISFSNADNNSASNNVISNSSSHGIAHISGSSNLISGNVSTNNTDSGIEILAGSNIVINMNNCNNNSAYGIVLAPGASNCFVNWNITQNNTTANYANNGGTAISTSFGTGTPEASVTASVGSQFLRTNGGGSTTLYIKESGTGNTGWVGK
jgi:hypothetical protein